MHIALSDEQQMLSDAVASFAARSYSPGQRGAIKRAGGFSPEVWQTLAVELGVLAIGIDEEAGGLAGGLIEAVLINREFGRCLLLEPYLEAVTYSGTLLKSTAGVRSSALQQAIADGSVIVVPALAEDASHAASIVARPSNAGWVLDGRRDIVIGGGQADTLLLSASVDGTGETLLVAIAADSPGVSTKSFQLIDGRSAADVILRATPVPHSDIFLRGEEADAAIETARNHAIVALGGTAIGVLETMVELTVDYAKQRRQFGQAIGSFQVLQHRMVDMHLETEKVRSATFAVAATLGSDRIADRKQTSLLKALISNASRSVGESAIQVHGGIGTTDELFVSHHFRRSIVLRDEYGSRGYHLSRIASQQMAPQTADVATFTAATMLTPDGLTSHA